MKNKLLPGFHLWRNSLVGQLLLRFWVFNIFFLTIIGYIQYYSLKDSLYQNVEQNLRSDYQSIRYSLIDWVLHDELPPGRFSELKPGNFVAFYTPDSNLGFLIYSYGRVDESLPIFLKHDLPIDLPEKAQTDKPFVQNIPHGESYLMLVKPVLNNTLFPFAIQDEPIPSNTSGPKTSTLVRGYLLIGEPLTSTERLLRSNLHGYLFNALLIFLLSTLFTALALQKPISPLLTISSIARKIAGGQYNLRIPPMNVSTEIQQLRDALNHMLGQMEQALHTERNAKERMARFIADASHELRTPLTSIHGFLEILQRKPNIDQESLDAAHQTMLTETERLIRLTESLLTLNRLAQENRGASDPSNSSTTLEEVLPDLLPLLSSLLEERSLRINHHLIEDYSLENPQEVPISCCDQLLPLKPDELKQILYNLIQNAIEHTKSDGEIHLLAARTPDQFQITVKDNGKGIPPEDIPHVFERFYRADRSRSRRKGQGSGLGLSIVSEIIRLRSGSIRAESTLGEGTSFIITFPEVSSKKEV